MMGAVNGGDEVSMSERKWGMNLELLEEERETLVAALESLIQSLIDRSMDTLHSLQDDIVEVSSYLIHTPLPSINTSLIHTTYASLNGLCTDEHAGSLSGGDSV